MINPNNQQPFPFVPGNAGAGAPVQTAPQFGAVDPFEAGAPNIFDQVAAQQMQQQQMAALLQQAPQPQAFQQQTWGAPQQSQVPAQGQSPMDKYVPVVDNNPQQMGAPVQQQPQRQQQPPAYQPPKVLQNNFMDYQKTTARSNYIPKGAVNEEVMQQILNGDVNALTGLLNKVAQTTAASTAYMMQNQTRNGVNALLKDMKEHHLPAAMKEQQFTSMWDDADAILNHPAVAGMRSAAEAHIRSQFPEATPQEVKEKTMEYIKDFSTVFRDASPNAGEMNMAPQQPESSVPQANDAEAFFGVETEPSPTPDQQ